MTESTEKVQWHPAFYTAIEAELVEYARYLRFVPERQLTTEPLRVDLLVIKKLKDIQINKNIGRIFLRDNLLEYKAPGDSLAVSDYNKVFGYAYLYAYLEKLDIREITVTFVVSAHPDSVVSYLNQRVEISVEKVSDGIYYVHNEIMPVQIITTNYLPEGENLWLSSLTDKLKGTQFEKVIQERKKLSIETNALLYTLALANPELIKEEQIKMGTTLNAVMDEIGYINKKTLGDKIAKLVKDVEFAKMAKEQAEAKRAQAEAEKEQLQSKYMDLQKKQLDAVIDMLRHGTPVSLITNWTSLPEDEIRRLQTTIELPFRNSETSNRDRSSETEEKENL